MHTSKTKQNLDFQRVVFDMALKNYDSPEVREVNVRSLSQFRMETKMDGFRAIVNYL